MVKNPAPEIQISSLRKMLLIRKVEEKLMDVFGAGEIPGFIHVCIGQEAAPVAVCSHLKPSDCLSSNHRGHGHALAKGIDLKSFMAELYGRRNGPCRGRSGSMHLADYSLGLLGANGIVGGGISIAVGAAFAAKYKKTDQVTVVFFGEGASNEGTFHESLNMAALMKLPIVFICENNRWAEFTPQEVHMPVEGVAVRASAYGMPGVAVPNQFLAIYEASGEAIKRARDGEGPTLIEIRCHRWFGHFVGDAQKYRPPEDIERARQIDCIVDLKEYLIENGWLTEEDVKNMEAEIVTEIEDAVSFARQSPKPDPSELMEGVYS
ncbi:MAG: pyruvate dehydrogenase (acetyl-transferring) E1 component subunit alpha [Deltaproteobacteria bacterium]|nr:MAG: pyruvate dehydrogenase (acetyl-transferring) E1 component subunit alpha [Deltaproteobacteria bacterium]